MKKHIQTDETYHWKYGVNIAEITSTISITDIDPTITSSSNIIDKAG